MDFLTMVLLLSQAKNEAQELYTKMQEKLRTAKTAQFTFKSTLEKPDEKWEGTVWLAEGNRACVEMTRHRAQNPYSLTLVCDGKQLHWSNGARKAVAKAPDTFNADFVALFAKIGAVEDRLEDLFRGRHDKLGRFEASDFAMGAQEIRFTVKVTGRGGGMDAKLWIDPATHLPLKRTASVKEQPDQVLKEEYSDWKIGEPTDDAKFEVPKE